MASCNATTFYGRDRRLQGVFAAARDVTERKLAAETHGGNIGVESEVDKGSTFWFTVPS